MICKQCKNQISDDSSFCPVCGAPVEAQPQPQAQTPPQAPPPVSPGMPPQQPVYYNPADDYRILGGFLKAVVILLKIVGPILMGISLLVTLGTSIYSIMKILRYINTYSYLVKTIIVLILGVADTAFGIFILLNVGSKLEKRDAGFLKFYQMFLPIQIGIGFIINLIQGTGIAGKLGTAIPSLVISIVVFVLWNLYFVKSLRVYVYMGSDAYLRNSIFTKNVPAPGTSPYQQPPYQQPPTYN
ncbi:MAG: zinc ribbon domain-containing protein [Ruminococcaceae bacterium]|nr:zinc ribbon domain-containing protein [Oscillospiraceae bacterium]